MKQFTLEYWEDERWYVGRLVEIPGIFSQGDSLEALKENIQDAYEIMLKAEPLSMARKWPTKNMVRRTKCVIRITPFEDNEAWQIAKDLAR